MSKKLEWREDTPDGDVRTFSASRHAGRWSFRARLKSEEEWTDLAHPPLEDLVYLRELLWNKYQRKRVPHEQVVEVDALIEATRRRG